MNTTVSSAGCVAFAVMEVLVLVLVGIITVGGLYRIVWDEIRQSRRADKVAQEPPKAKASAESPIVPIQQDADERTNSTEPDELLEKVQSLIKQ